MDRGLLLACRGLRAFGFGAPTGLGFPGEAAGILRALGTPCLIHQPKYSMFNRWIEQGLLAALREQGNSTVELVFDDGILVDTQ